MLWCLGWAAVAALSLVPPAAIPNVGNDKLAHMLVYAWMAAAAVSFCRCPARLAVLALVTMLAGGALELAQGMVAHRHLDVADAVANGIGATLGYLVALAALLVVRRPWLQGSPSPS